MFNLTIKTPQRRLHLKSSGESASHREASFHKDSVFKRSGNGASLALMPEFMGCELTQAGLTKNSVHVGNRSASFMFKAEKDDRKQIGGRTFNIHNRASGCRWGCSYTHRTRTALDYFLTGSPGLPASYQTDLPLISEAQTCSHLFARYTHSDHRSFANARHPCTLDTPQWYTLLVYSPFAITFTLLLCVVLVTAADLYKALDLHKSASEQDIRKAYKRLSRKYHPDKNKEEGAEDRFVEIAHAYEVLSDSEKRRIYDQYGEDGLKAHEGGQPFHANPFDMFSSFFGGGHHGHDQVRRGPTSVSEFEVTLADVYKGASIDFMIKKRVLCDHCRGSGAASDSHIHTCTVCGGSGVRLAKQQIFPGMFATTQQTCNECGGRGKVIKKQCPHCKGEKVIDYNGRYTLEIPKGVPEGHEVVFEGEGDESPDWEAGDVVLRVRSRSEKGGWRRKESSLYWKETIGVDEALLGFERNLTHLDGHIVTLSRKGVTQPGFVQTIEDEGMPVFEQSSFGNLYIEYNVVLPTVISEDTRRHLAEAFYGKDHSDRDRDEL
ncbi:hypothetical protein OF83DRAFT_1167486 [Amylostereum chailletii]|nr:hypothetical protein OF83DRAFT_1167486 [Amylostereum chailletii]